MQGHTYTVCLCLKRGRGITVHAGALRVTIDCGEQGNDVRMARIDELAKGHARSLFPAPVEYGFYLFPFDVRKTSATSNNSTFGPISISRLPVGCFSAYSVCWATKVG